MAATGFLVFYRFKAMNKEEAEKAKGEWGNLRNGLPSGIELVGEYIHAWGTEYNGFLLFESNNADSFLDWWSKFKDTIRWYVEQTHTITARRRLYLSSYSSSYSSSSLLDNRNTSTILLATDSENADDAIKKKETRKKGTRKGKHASSTENRRLVWERIVWPLILQVNREYFTFEEYRTKRDKFCSIYTNVSPFRLSRGLTSLVERAILIKNRTSNIYSIHYRLVPYMRRGLNLEYGLAVKKTCAKA